MRMVTKYWGRNATIMILIFFSEACDTKSLKFCSSYSVVGLELQENNLIKKERPQWCFSETATVHLNSLPLFHPALPYSLSLNRSTGNKPSLFSLPTWWQRHAHSALLYRPIVKLVTQKLTFISCYFVHTPKIRDHNTYPFFPGVKISMKERRVKETRNRRGKEKLSKGKICGLF